MEIVNLKETSEVEISYNEEGRKMINEFVMHNLIGKGSYSKVKLAYSIKDNKFYAIKIINKNLLERKKKCVTKDSEGNMMFKYMIEDAMNEINILKELNTGSTHKNVIKLYQILNYEDKYEEKSKIYLVLEYCQRGCIINYNDRTGVFSINQYYKKNERDKQYYSEEEIKRFVKDMAQGLEYIHSRNVIHRDIKTDNVLINENGDCKFIDFSIASIIKEEDSFTKTEGNIYFYPPEFCGGKKIFKGKPVDVWALGITIYAITFHKLPFIPDNPSNLIELFRLIKNAEQISDEFKDFFLKVLEKDPLKRISSSQILEHKFLN